MASVYLGLGSNESPDINLSIAIRELTARYGELKRSAVYRGAAVGFDGADFLNLVVSLQSNQSPLDICGEIELIHNLAGRVREGNKWESRPLDIDLLLYDDLVSDERPVRVPRDDILQYSFVLRPIAELAPALLHPLTGSTVLEHWQNFDSKNQPLEKVNVDW
ncbi:MAG: 2-amino-4-hydroxy-6-hydroxymethyldihydropteridine diphosphokinase [Woeseiaceae bacterium]|nr:2-amino-4-hydroxy-6-hydroxymethyldihydropteridine diphosphokinase [Woeseiaceae bacterium]